MPAEFLDLGLEIKWDNYGGEGIYLADNPLESPPVEIIKKGSKKSILSNIHFLKMAITVPLAPNPNRAMDITILAK